LTPKLSNSFEFSVNIFELRFEFVCGCAQCDGDLTLKLSNSFEFSVNIFDLRIESSTVLSGNKEKLWLDLYYVDDRCAVK